VSTAIDIAAKLRYVRPNRDAWRQRAGLSPMVFRALTRDTEARLRDWDGGYDVVLQINTVFAPGARARERHVIYTDNVHVLTARYFPKWAPLSARDRAERIRLESETCRSARYVFAKSRLLKTTLIEDYGCDPERVVHVTTGSNRMAPSLDGKRWDSAAALFVGIHFERKGGHVLLQAWPRVRELVPEAQLWIVGPRQAPPEADQPGITWHGFVGDRDRLTELYATASAFVLPAFFEPYGMAVLEARGQGLACIGTDRGGFAEDISEGGDGLLVPAGEPEPLAQALASLLGDTERAEAMGRRAHQDVLANHTWGHVTDRMAPYLERVAEGVAA
jgi:glycosyltransferase involved in cell wall biosynthesis